MKKENTQALSGEINKEVIDILLNRVDINSRYVDELVNDVVRKYCGPLDTLIHKIDAMLVDSRSPVPMDDLDFFAMKLPTAMFYVGEAQEAVGIREDVSKAVRLEKFNSVHSSAVGTIADKDAKAELASQQEYIVNTVFSRAFKMIKARMEVGSDMLTSVKKVISRRLVEMQLTGVSDSSFKQYDGRRIINEDTD